MTYFASKDVIMTLNLLNHPGMTNYTRFTRVLWKNIPN